MTENYSGPRLGVHVSISGSIDLAVDRALALSCDTMQIFTRSPRTWRPKELTTEKTSLFVKKIKLADFYDVTVHMPYLPNLASPNDELWLKSILVLKEEIVRTDKLSCRYLVTHLGSPKGLSHKDGIDRVVSAINSVVDILKKTSGLMLLLENSTGKKSIFGNRFDEIGEIIDKCDISNRVGLCLDTAHAYSAGYDISTYSGFMETLETIDDKIGKDKLKVVHVNDSKGGLGSGIDRHEHIGKGFIGLECFSFIMNEPFFRGIPCILETPKTSPDDDLKSLKLLRSIQK